MAEQPEIPEGVTAKQFFEELMPAGYEVQRAEGIAPPAELSIQYHIAGDGGGSWHVHMAGEKMTVTAGEQESNLTIRLSIGDFLDALYGRNGADLALVVPQSRPGRPDTSARAKDLTGTIELELERDGEPFRTETTFGGSDQPRTTLKAKIEDYVAIQQGKMNGQEAFMTGKVRIEGDMAFMMQVSMLTA
jgi:hypothetical protein